MKTFVEYISVNWHIIQEGLEHDQVGRAKDPNVWGVYPRMYTIEYSNYDTNSMMRQYIKIIIIICIPYVRA